MKLKGRIATLVAPLALVAAPPAAMAQDSAPNDEQMAQMGEMFSTMFVAEQLPQAAGPHPIED